MAIISANLQFNRGGHGLLDYSSLQANYSAALAWAKDVNSNAAVGQFIYLAAAETIGEVEYAKGPYVVDAIGEAAVLTPLSKSVAGEQDLSDVVTDLKGNVGTLTSGLATTDSSVNALEEKVNALPANFVTDVKDASGNSLVVDGVATLGDYATKSDVNAGLAIKADSSVVYTKDEADSTFVKSEGYVAFSQIEKDKLAAIAEGAEVNYINSVGDNLSVDSDGKLTVSIPEVAFQSVAENDKVLTLDKGVLSSTLAYTREEVEGVDSLVLKGINGTVIGSVPVADFIADGMLESVTPEEGTNNFIFTFKTDNDTTKSFKVDFSKYVDVYNADETTLELKVVDGKNVFNVKADVFDVAGAAATAEDNAKAYADGKFQEKGNYETAGAAAAVESKLNEYKESNDAVVAEKVDTSVYTTKVTKIDSSISAIITDLAKKADSSVVEDALAGKVDIVEGSSLVSDTLIAKLDNMVEIKSVGGDLTLTDGALSVDLSSYATIADTSANFIQKDGDKVLSTNDFTNEFKTKLEGVAPGAEVNYVKSVGSNLAVSDTGELTVDLSTYAKYEDVSTALANKLDASVTVNGISFIDDKVVLDADDIKASVAFGTLKSGETTTDRYTTNDSIQTILSSLDSRIDAINTVFDETFEGVIVSVQGSNAIGVTSGTSPEISLKVSSETDNVVGVKTDGIYVADMRSYWEGI